VNLEGKGADLGNRRKWIAFVLGGLLWVAAACQPASRTPEATQALFVPPPPPTATPTPVGTPAEPKEQPTLACQDNLSFISDVTIPDGSEVEANSTMDKRWEVENSGGCNWDETYRLRLISGDSLGAEEEQMLFPARSGTRLVLRIVFQAPAEPGTYRSAWQAHNPDGQAFGDPVFIDFVVP